MDGVKLLLISGVTLLSGSALLGFVQHRQRGQPDSFARWRVVHAGGTAGAVQLLALSAVWQRLAAPRPWASSLLAIGIASATWAFFLGPLMKALGHARAASVVNGVGALIAAPSYLALPVLVLL